MKNLSEVGQQPTNSAHISRIGASLRCEPRLHLLPKITPKTTASDLMLFITKLVVLSLDSGNTILKYDSSKWRFK